MLLASLYAIKCKIGEFVKYRNIQLEPECKQKVNFDATVGESHTEHFDIIQKSICVCVDISSEIVYYVYLLTLRADNSIHLLVIHLHARQTVNMTAG